MSRERIWEWLKRYKSRIIVAVLIMCVLTVAFFMGDSHNNSNNVNSSGNSVVSSKGELTEKDKDFNKLLQSDSSNNDKDSEQITDSSESESLNKQKIDDDTDKVEEGISQPSGESVALENSHNIEDGQWGESQISEDQTANQSVINQSAEGQEANRQPDNPVSSTEEPASEENVQQGGSTDTENLTCNFSISCASILNNMDKLDKDKKDLVPEDGWILKPVTVEYYQGETVFDVLKRECMSRKIHMESSWTPLYNSAYIEGINNLYQFDCGSLSGWMFCVNGIFINYGCSKVVINNGDVIEFIYTCDLGKDIQK